MREKVEFRVVWMEVWQFTWLCYGCSTAALWLVVPQVILPPICSLSTTDNSEGIENRWFITNCIAKVMV